MSDAQGKGLPLRGALRIEPDGPGRHAETGSGKTAERVCQGDGVEAFLDVMDKFDMPPAYLNSDALTRLVNKDYAETGELIKSLGIGLYKK